MCQSDESGADEIYVRPFPNVEAARIKVSPAGGSRPMWSKDGQEIFYSQSASLVSVAASERAETLSLGTPQSIVATNAYPPFVDGRPYDVSVDGQRFLMLKAAVGQSSTDPHLVIVQNWFSELPSATH